MAGLLSQVGRVLANTTNFFSKPEPPKKPLPEICIKIQAGRIDGKKLLSGGEKEDWDKTIGYVKKWRSILVENDWIEKLPIERVKQGIENEINFDQVLKTNAIKLMGENYGQYDDLISGSTFNFTSEEEVIYQEFVNKVIDRHVSANVIDNDLAEQEIEVLKKGGAILGVYEKKILVYFPFTSESVMASLLKDNTRPPKPHRIKNFGSTVYSTFNGSGWGGAGMGGIMGGGGSGFTQLTTSGSLNMLTESSIDAMVKSAQLSTSPAQIVVSPQMRKRLIGGICES